MGGIRVPPLPMYMILVDRDDGTEWYLSHDASHTHFAINDGPLPVTNKYFYVKYDAFEGPLVGVNPTVRLYIRDGHLGYDTEELPEYIHYEDNQRVLSRRGFERFTCEVRLPSTGFVEGRGLVWEGLSVG